MNPEVKQAIDGGLMLLQEKCGRTAREHGFWINKDSPDRLLMLMVGELSEAHEDLRNGRDVKEVYYEAKFHEENGVLIETQKPCGFGVELADVVIRIMDAAEQLGIPLNDLILAKMEYNESRPYLHGRKF